MVKAGTATDATIDTLKPLLEKGIVVRMLFVLENESTQRASHAETLMVRSGRAEIQRIAD